MTNGQGMRQLPTPIEATLMAGNRLGRFELLFPLATGGMGAIWVGRAAGGDELFALKLIVPMYASDERFRTMFVDEARIARSIDHANVARTYEVGDSAGTLFLAMEYVDGDSIARLLRWGSHTSGENALPPAIALRIVADAAAGLHAAHELCDANGLPLDVVHRDVSPQNLVLSSRGIVKVIDFGIAKARGRLSRETTVGTVRGKHHFMAPEQALGHAVDRRADVWSLGAVLFHLVSGVYPNDASLRGGEPVALSSEIPACVKDVISSTLRRDPYDRLATAAELQAAIEWAMKRSALTATRDDVARFAAPFLASIDESRRLSLELAERTIRARAESRSLQAASAVETSARMPSPSPEQATSETTVASLEEAPGGSRRQSRSSRRAASVIAIGAIVAVGLVAGSLSMHSRRSKEARLPPSELATDTDTASTAPPQPAPPAVRAVVSTESVGADSMLTPSAPAARTPGQHSPQPAISAGRRAKAISPSTGSAGHEPPAPIDFKRRY